MIIEDDEEEGAGVVEMGNDNDSIEEELTQLNLSSIGGKLDVGIMKLKGYHKKRKLNVLIDNGSSLNFLDLYVA